MELVDARAFSTILFSSLLAAEPEIAPCYCSGPPITVHHLWRARLQELEADTAELPEPLTKPGNLA